MKQRPDKTKDITQHLRGYRKRYERVKARLHELGFIVRGSFVQQRLSCGNPNCRCRRNARFRHGPYHSITWKEKGRTVSRFLPAKIVPLYRQWNRNARLLKAILAQMHEISRAAADCARATQTVNSKTMKSKKGKRAGA